MISGMTSHDQDTTQTEAGDSSAEARPSWRRPEIAILDVEHGTLLTNSGNLDGGPSGSTS